MANTTINIIQIKRSKTVDWPTGLQPGELAYSFAAANTLYIGDAWNIGSAIPIGGGNYYYLQNITPGQTIPNQVLVPDTLGYLNEVNTYELNINGIPINSINTFSNSTVLGLASNTELVSSWAIKNYIDFQVSGAGLITFTTSDSNTVASSDVNIFGTSGITTTSFSNTITVGLSDTGVIPGIYTAPIITVDAQGRITDIDSSGFSSILTYAGDIGVDNINLFGDVFRIVGGPGVRTFANNLNNTLTITANHNNIDNYNANQHIDHSTLYINVGNGLVGGGVLTGNTTLSVNVPVNSGLVSNTAGLHVKTGLGVYLDTSGNVAIGQEVFQTSNVIFNDGTFTGNLFVQGEVTYIHTNTLEVIDPLIRLASNNSVNDIVDIGFYGEYNPGTGQRFTGLFRDATDGLYKLFENGTAQPSSTVVPPYNLASLVANITQGVVSNLLQPIAVSDGGTGVNNLAVNGVLIGDGINPVKTVVGAPFEIFQIDSIGNPIWGILDCGTYP